MISGSISGEFERQLEGTDNAITTVSHQYPVILVIYHVHMYNN